MRSCIFLACLALPGTKSLSATIWRPTIRWLLPLALVLAALLNSAPTSVRADSPPAIVYGAAAIPAGRSATHISGRFITANSRIVVSVDMTTWPGETFVLPGLKVDTVRDGYFDVRTLDNSLAPASGVPFNYVVFNANSVAPYYFIGEGTLGSGAFAVNVSNANANPDSVIILSIDATSLPSSTAVTQALKIDGRGTGAFTVKTLDAAAASTNIHFNYVIVNDPNRDFAGRQTILGGNVRVQFSKATISNPVAFFLTVDTTEIASNSALPGVYLLTRGAGSAYVTTQNRVKAPAGGVPFNFVMLLPPNRWEEYGPTGFSGNTWSIVADPRNRLVLYAASSFGGVWKSTNGGDSWISAWDGPPDAPIYRLTIDPDNPDRIWALNRSDGSVWVTENGALTWTEFREAAAVSSLHSPGGAFLATPGGLLWVCSTSGLYFIIPSLGSSVWTLVQPDQAQTGQSGTYQCADVIIGPDNAVYAAFRDVGIWQVILFGSWKKLKDAFSGGRPIRLAVNPSKFVIHYDCLVFFNDVSTLKRNDLTSFESTWRQSIPGQGLLTAGQYQTDSNANVCRSTQGGYDAAIAISPADSNLVFVGGAGARITRDGGQTWLQDFPELGGDQHEAIFWDASTLFVAHDFGISISTDGGATWRQAEANRRVTDGPPVTEFYNLMVSRPDQFGRPLVGGAAQDRGSNSIVGRTSAFYTNGGEFGLGIVAPPLINRRSADGRRSSVFRTYTTFGGSPGRLDFCDTEIPGPDYLPPATFADGTPIRDDMFWPNSQFTKTQPDGSVLTNGIVCETAAPNFGSDNPVTAMAVSNQAIDRILVGTAKGDIYRAISGTNGRQYERAFFVDPPASVSAVGFLSNTVALIGFDNGAIYRINNPFGSPPTVAPLGVVHANRVVGFANLYGSTSELFVAYADSVWRSTTGGSSWNNITGFLTAQALQNSLNTGVQIVGIARDPNYPYLYVATGHSNWYGQWSKSKDPAVFRTALPTNGVWVRFSDGLPPIVPISGIGISPNRALFIATQGRGIWWRRDIAAVPPNSGVNAPDEGSSRVGALQLFTTTCSYPSGWRDIQQIEFKITLGLGPEEGDPFALWVMFDQASNRIRFVDPDTGEVSEGTPGENLILRSRFAEIDLSQSTAKGRGPTDPTVDITWAVRLLGPVSGTEMAQYLRVSDDLGASTIWDRVGSWSVAPNIYLPMSVDTVLAGW